VGWWLENALSLIVRRYGVQRVAKKSSPDSAARFFVEGPVSTHERRAWQIYCGCNLIGVAITLWFALQPHKSPFLAAAQASELRWLVQLFLVTLGVACGVALTRGFIALLVLDGRVPLLSLGVATDGTRVLLVRGQAGWRSSVRIDSGQRLMVASRASGFPTSHGKRLNLEKPSVWTLGTPSGKREVTAVWPLDAAAAEWLTSQIAPLAVTLDTRVNRF